MSDPVVMRPVPRRPQVTPRTVVMVVLTAVAVLVGIYLLWQLRQLVRWCVIAVFLATALHPAVDWLQRRRLPRGVAILLVYLALLLVVAGLVALLLPPLVTQARTLGAFIVDTVREPTGVTRTLQEFAQRYGLEGYLDALRSQVSALPGRLTTAGVRLLSITRGIIGSVTSLLSILLITFFLLLDGKRFVGGALSFVAPAQQPRVRRLLGQAADAVSGYITGNLIISLIAGVAAFFVLWVTDMPSPVPLALVVAFFDLIPLIGATLGSVVIIVVGFFVSPVTGGIMTVYFLIYQQIENNLIQPLVYGRSVSLHPLAVFLAAVAGAQLLGILGALLAIPVAEIIRILAVEWLSARKHPAEAAVVVTSADRPADQGDVGATDLA